MDRDEVLTALYRRFIAPTKDKRDKYYGVEIEMPIINLNGDAVDFTLVHQLTAAFAKQFKMLISGYDDEGNVCALKSLQDGDALSYDCSYNNIELAFGKEQDLHRIAGRFKTYYFYIQNFLKPFHYTLSGLGINPYRRQNHCVPIPNERYRMLFHHLGTYRDYVHPEFFHPYPDFGTYCSSSQVQIDVAYDRLIDTINAFSKLEPLKALLFANSVMNGEEKDQLCVRDMLWDNSMQGLNPRNTGMYQRPFIDEADLFDHLQKTSIYCTLRDGKYVNFPPRPVLKYFQTPIISGEFFNGTAYESIEIEPAPADLEHLRTFKHEDLTYRGTVEFRSCCCQPIADTMTVPAFHMGLIENLAALKDLLDNDKVLYGHGFTMKQLRKLFCYGYIPPFIDANELQVLLLTILDLAWTGLSKRRLGEEHFLNPLYERVFRRTNPAVEYVDALKSNVPVEELILRYAEPCS